MSRIVRIAFSGVFIALLLGCQFALGGVAGVELVTPLLLSFCFYFGVRQGVLVAVSFSLLRCLIFGFSPTALILYLIYYPLFALLFGGMGHLRHERLSAGTYLLLTLLAVVCTAGFTLLDDIITPVFYGFTWEQMKVYWIASLAVMLSQILCAAITVPLLVPPLLGAYRHLPHAAGHIGKK